MCYNPKIRRFKKKRLYNADIKTELNIIDKELRNCELY